MSFPRYPKYKDSGIEWLGAVPNHWRVTPLKRFARLTMGQSPASEDCNIEGHGLPFIQGNAEFGPRSPSPRSYCAVATKVAQPSDVLLSVRAPVGEVNIADQPVGIGRGLCALTAREPNNPVFLFYAVQAMQADLLSVATGSTYEAVTTDQVGAAALAVPDSDEQIAIATFLDLETAKLDALVAEQERLIELLKEMRQAVISHAVTKGLTPAAPMKASGIPWFGEVPRHWEIHNLRRVVSDFIDYRGRTPTKVDEGVPLITAGAVRNGRLDHARAPEYMLASEYEDFMRRGKPDLGDVVFTTEAPLGEVAQVTDTSVAFAQRIIVFKMNRDRMTGDFLCLFYLADAGRRELLSRASGSTAEGIRADRLRASLVVVPPPAEQAAIVRHVHKELERLEPLEAQIASQLELLQERRAALISAAVTGQIDVRNAAARSAA